MPASRSARAMIFAPRSWPSRPGLATTTRILRAVPDALFAVSSVLASMAWRQCRGSQVAGSQVAGWRSCDLRPATCDPLEHRRLRVRPEHFLERLHDLALARVRAGAVEQRLHQVGLALRGLL